MMNSADLQKAIHHIWLYGKVEQQEELRETLLALGEESGLKITSSPAGETFTAMDAVALLADLESHWTESLRESFAEWIHTLVEEIDSARIRDITLI